MRISALSTTNGGFQDEKVSLRKLSQVKALNNVQYYQHQHQKSEVKPYQIIMKPQSMAMGTKDNIVSPKYKQSHIQWTGGNCCGSAPKPTSLTNNNSNYTSHNQTLYDTGKLRAARKKIFQYQHSQHPTQIATFSNMGQYPNQQQTQYYSMMVTPPFITNLENSKQVDYNNSNRSPLLSYQSRGLEGSQSLGSLTGYHIPKLERKLEQHDQQLMTIREYLKNAQKLSELKDSIKEFQQIQVMRIRQEEVKNKRLMIMNEIAEAKLRQRQLGRLGGCQQVDGERMGWIEEERVRRLEKIRRQNQQLKHDLSQREYKQPQLYNNTTRDIHNQQPPSSQYRFHGPLAFPSKDWDSQQEILQQHACKSFQRSDNSKGMTTYRRGYNTADLQVSPVLRKKMHEISSIGFTTNNKGESFSLQANTFRDFTSPLDFQGENQPW